MKGLISLVTAMSFAGSAAGAEVLVFGLPLGGVVTPKFQQCPVDHSKRKRVCWIEKPFAPKTGGAVGTVFLPDANAPDWAAMYLPDVVLDSRGQLEVVAFNSIELRHWEAAMTSIRQRFSLPTEAGKEGLTRWSSWSLPDLEIKSGCHVERCYVRFMSRQAVLAAEAARKAAPVRPATP